MFTPHEKTNYCKSNLQERPISNYMEIKAQCVSAVLLVGLCMNGHIRSDLSLCFLLYISLCAFLPRQNPIQDLHVCSSNKINKIQLKIAASVFADRIPLTIL